MPMESIREMAMQQNSDQTIRLPDGRVGAAGRRRDLTGAWTGRDQTIPKRLIQVATDSTGPNLWSGHERRLVLSCMKL
jgi:hypothetical protein